MMLVSYLVCLFATLTFAIAVDPLKIAAFNVRLTRSKMRDSERANVIRDIVRRYDVIFIQDIRDKRGIAIQQLWDLVDTTEYGLEVSARLGDDSKAQYGYFYKKSSVELKEIYQFGDSNNVFDREPFCARFQAIGGSQPFGVIGLQTNNDVTLNELGHLMDVFIDVSTRWTNLQGVIMMGDFNADCGYASESSLQTLELYNQNEYLWVIDSNMDTTTGSSNCAYDRIILSGNNIKNAYVPGSGQPYNFGIDYNMDEEEAGDISGRYPVEMLISQATQTTTASPTTTTASPTTTTTSSPTTTASPTTTTASPTTTTAVPTTTTASPTTTTSSPTTTTASLTTTTAVPTTTTASPTTTTSSPTTTTANPITTAATGLTSPLKTAAFNIKTFGKTKMSDPAKAAVIRDIVKRYDLILIQEVRDISGESLQQLWNSVDPNVYGMVVSVRLGRTSYKEQYVYFYRYNKLTLINELQYVDGLVDIYEREPFSVQFAIIGANWNFGVIGLHAKPDDAVHEIDHLYDVYLNVSKTWSTVKDYIIMGDFNADCSYASDADLAPLEIYDQNEFNWLINSSVDTSMSTNTNCAYDRIVITGPNINNAYVNNSAGIYVFENDFNLNYDQAYAISDHYPVEMTLF